MFTLLLRHDSEPVEKLPLGRYPTLRGAKMALAYRTRHPVQDAWLYIHGPGNEVLVICPPAEQAYLAEQRRLGRKVTRRTY